MPNEKRLGILGKDEICALINSGTLVKGANKSNLRGASYDMTVGIIFVDGEIRRSSDGAFSHTVRAGGVINIFTTEELDLPSDIVATAFAINQMSSRGFLVLNPGHVDPGFKGALTVKALNVRKVPYVVQSGDPVFTVVFERLSTPTIPYSHNQRPEERERLFNKEIVETSCNSFSDLVLLDPDGPYPSREQVREEIRNHWTSWLTMGFAAVAAFVSLILLAREFRPPPSVRTPNQSTMNQQFDASSDVVASKSSMKCPDDCPRDEEGAPSPGTHDTSGSVDEDARRKATDKQGQQQERQ